MAGKFMGVDIDERGADDGWGARRGVKRVFFWAHEVARMASVAAGEIAYL